MSEHAAAASMTTLIAPAINLAILVGFLAVKVKQPIKDMVRTRHSSLRDELRAVREKLATSQERYDEFSRKLKAMDSEISSLRDQARQDAKAAQEKILSESKKLAASIVTESKSSAGNLFTDLKSQLLNELGIRVLDRAEAMLKSQITGADKIRIRQEFSSQVEKAQ